VTGAAPAEGLRVHLLGRPVIEGQHAAYRMRSRKSWALLTYLLLAERAPTRRELAALLFERTADPLGALRWCLAEVRRALGPDAVITGDPVELRLGPAVVVDASVVLAGPSDDAHRVRSLGSELLEGLALEGAFDFESWLLGARRRVAAATALLLREAAVAAAGRGAYDTAIGHAVRLSTLSRLDEHTHALLVGLYRVVGDDLAAQRQYVNAAKILQTELGMAPGDVMRHALCRPLWQLARGDLEDPGWQVQDSNLRRHTPTDLQSASIGRSDNLPCSRTT
jgi:DNA-binding SARP family transcriptional activator